MELNKFFNFNKIFIRTTILCVGSVLLGIVVLFFLIIMGNNISDIKDRGVTQYENFTNKIIGYLARDERRELHRR